MAVGVRDGFAFLIPLPLSTVDSFALSCTRVGLHALQRAGTLVDSAGSVPIPVGRRLSPMVTASPCHPSCTPEACPATFPTCSR